MLSTANSGPSYGHKSRKDCLQSACFHRPPIAWGAGWFSSALGVHSRKGAEAAAGSEAPLFSKYCQRAANGSSRPGHPHPPSPHARGWGGKRLQLHLPIRPRGWRLQKQPLPCRLLFPPLQTFAGGGDPGGRQGKKRQGLQGGKQCNLGRNPGHFLLHYFYPGKGDGEAEREQKSLKTFQ